VINVQGQIDGDGVVLSNGTLLSNTSGSIKERTRKSLIDNNIHDP